MPPVIDYSSQRILLIDSSGNLRSTIKSMLESIGYQQVRAISISERVLDVIEENEFDIILLGHNVHDRYSGLQLLEEARFRDLIRPTCSWVLMSSDPSQQSMLFAIEAQPDDVLIKPFTMDELRHRLDSLCRQRAALAPIEKAMERKAPNRAIKLCESLLNQADPNYDRAQLLKGRLLLETGQFDRAEPVFERYYWQGEDPKSGYYLAECQFHLGKLGEAQQLLESMVAEQPLFISAYDLLARVYEARGNLEQAQQVLQNAVSRSPLVIQRQLELGRVATHNRQLDIAEQAYRKSVNLGEHSCQATPESFLRLANVQRLQLKDAEQGQQQNLVVEIDSLLSKARRRYSGDPRLAVQSQLLMARVHEDLGQNEQASACLEQAQQRAEAADIDSDMEQLRQQALAEQPPKRQRPAEQQPVEALMVNDPATSARVNRIGVRNYLAGKPAQAMRYFGMAFEHDNGNASALLNLAQLFLEAARDTPSRSEERIKMFRRYLRLAQRLSLSATQQHKFKQLNEFSTMILRSLPEGPLGNLLK